MQLKFLLFSILLFIIQKSKADFNDEDEYDISENLNDLNDEDDYKPDIICENGIFFNNKCDNNIF